MLVQEDVAHRLAERGIVDSGDPLLLLLGEAKPIDVVSQIGGRGKGELRLVHLARDIQVVERRPDPVEVFMGHVLARHLPDGVELGTSGGIGIEIAGTERDQPLNLDQRLLDALVGGAGGPLRHLVQEPAERQDRGPARQAVVADIDDAAEGKAVADEVDDRLPMLGHHPGIDAVQHDHIEGRQVERGELLE